MYRFISDLTTREKGYRVVGDPASQSPQRTSWPSKKLGRIAIGTALVLVLGFAVYSFSPTAVAAWTPPPPPKKNPGGLTENLEEPAGPPDVDWGFIGEQEKTGPGIPVAAAPQAEAPQSEDPNAVVEEPPTVTTPIPPSESDFYGVAPEETPHVPGPDFHASERPEDQPSNSDGPVPEADLEAQEEDFVGQDGEKPSVAEAESEAQGDKGEKDDEGANPLPEEWKEPTPPEWDDASLEPENMEEAYKAANESDDSEDKVEENQQVDEFADPPYVVPEDDVVTSRGA